MRGDSVEALDGSTPRPARILEEFLQPTGGKFRATRRAAGLRGCEPICGGRDPRVAHERTSVGSTLLEAPPRTERDTFTMSPPYPPVPLKCRGPWDDVLDGLGRPRRVIGDLDVRRTHPTRRRPRWLRSGRLRVHAGSSRARRVLRHRLPIAMLAGTFASAFAMPRAHMRNHLRL